MLLYTVNIIYKFYVFYFDFKFLRNNEQFISVKLIFNTVENHTITYINKQCIDIHYEQYYLIKKIRIKLKTPNFIVYKLPLFLYKYFRF